ncbi:hypothetical protein GSI_04001 [Ganoderma sinense ZZ0214-1]|uniref:Poly A polymerase head domain-containing protein n=1 Tax=Ganoderma sinense ZZ0214-1 TaxID=1077348 RepID=A0A2G8SI02_9APHY|nr:hypothetical protein GSI_04001 [Ganoderma sinense ZZ0214-1]
MSNLNLSRLGPRAAGLAKFMVDRAQEVHAPCVLIGASALIMRGVIDRETKDLDFNIAPHWSGALQHVIAPHLQSTRNEAVLVDGATQAAKAVQTSFRFFKQVDEAGDNMKDPADFLPYKVDVSENMCALTPNAFTKLDGVYVATVPLMVIFKMCALARPNRSTWSDKALKDATDLVLALRYLRAHNEVIPPNILGFLAYENPRFLWANFWNALSLVVGHVGTTVQEVEQLLHALGVAKTRD